MRVWSALSQKTFAIKNIATKRHFTLTLWVFGFIFGSATAAEPVLTPFSGAAFGPPPAPWRVGTLPGQTKPVTQFEIVELDGQHVLKVQADKSYGNLVHPWRGTVHQLKWRWRLDKALLRADLRRKEGDDVALKVCVLFDMPTDKLALGERLQLSLARSLSRENLPAATLCYVWDHSLPVGTVLHNAFTHRLRYIVVDSGETQLHQWVSRQRDVAADFAAVFGEESATLPPAVAIGIGADGDNTQDSSQSHVADIVATP
jgi:Protein of unknown function (DUF3047)